MRDKIIIMEKGAYKIAKRSPVKNKKKKERKKKKGKKRENRIERELQILEKNQ